MKIRKLLLLLACAIGAMVSCDTPETIPQSYTRFVEPRIGTAHCRYFHFAPGAMPFGMAATKTVGRQQDMIIVTSPSRVSPVPTSFRWAALC